jgi:Signal transduction histidine kinase
MENLLPTELNNDVSVKNDTLLPIISRIAIYDNMRSIPRIIDFSHDSIQGFIDEVPQKVYAYSHELGGKIPYTILKEIVENLIHANFKEIIITIMENGNHILISDQGPGITDKEKVFFPGFTSASKSMKKYIRGVGSGLPIVKEVIVFSGGSVGIEDNIQSGTVISLRLESPAESFKNLHEDSYSPSTDSSAHGYKKLLPDYSEIQKNENTPENIVSTGKQPRDNFESLKLSIRQTRILSLVLELEETGPSKIAKELDLSLATSFRELVLLEGAGLLMLTGSGKRKLTSKGKKYLEYYSNNF